MGQDSEPIIIKRYANRKLYNTDKSCYVTLTEIDQMLGEGSDVKIIDYKTKEDITSVTLAQILFEKEKSHKTLPSKTLKEFLRQSGDRLNDILQRTVNIGEGLREGAEKQIDAIEQAVQKNTEETSVFFRDMLQGYQTSLEDFQQKVDEKVKRALTPLTNVAELRQEVKTLGEKVEKLEGILKAYEAKEMTDKDEDPLH